MKKELKALINEAYSAPEPERKKEFLRKIRPREVSTYEFILNQASYIRLSIWLFALAAIALVVTGSILHLNETEDMLTFIMPFTAALSVLETRRSERFNMTELEMATRFSLRSVIFARMIVLGAVSAIIMIVSAPIIAWAFEESILLTAIRVITPYLVTMFVSLFAERSIVGRKNGYLSLAVASAVSIMVFGINHFKPEAAMAYTGMLKKWGIVIVLILIIMTLFEQWKTLNEAEAFA